MPCHVRGQGSWGPSTRAGMFMGSHTTRGHVSQVDRKWAVIGHTDLLTWLWPIERGECATGSRACPLTYMGMHSQQSLVSPKVHPPEGSPKLDPNPSKLLTFENHALRSG